MNKKSVNERLKALLPYGSQDGGTQLPEAGAPRKRVGLAVRKQAPPAKVEAPVVVPSAPARVSFGVAKSAQVGTPSVSRPGPIRMISQWSYSRLSDWENCPLKAKFKHVDKMREPGSAAMDRGSLIHTLAEKYVKGEIKIIPPEIAAFQEEFAELKKSNPVCESEWGFTKEWKPTGYFGSDVWLRVKTDVFSVKKNHGRIIDHKTGQEKEAHDQQLSLYGTSLLIQQPKVEVVSTELWYLDQGTKRSVEFTRDQLPEMIEHWNERVRPMLEDKSFVATPNRLCNWCFFRKSNGGPCQW